MTRVVITGLGTVGPCGCGLETLVAALEAGRPSFSEVDRSAGHHRGGSSRLAGLAAGQDLSPWVPQRAARRMSPPSRMAVAAARMALRAAGLEDDAGGPGTAVALSSAIGPASATEKLLSQIREEGPTAASPFDFTESVANAPAAQVALAVGARGPNATITQREAGCLLALGRGAADVRAGRVRRALVGAVDEVTPLTHAVFDGFGALARPAPARPEAARPLDRGRDGFVLAEGATVLVLEREEDARARGARPLARVLALFGGHDPTATVTDWGTGETILGERIRRGLEHAGLSPDSLDGVVSGASGSRRGDRLEGRTLVELFPDPTRRPPVLAPKAVTGEFGGGLLGAAVAALHGRSGPPPGPHREDPEIGLMPAWGGVTGPRGRVLVSALAAGGTAAWAVLERAG
ncbi:MAG: beta-ketoacyl synthase N-terminal-like domain-containing protein [Acidobacteriota bacterium]|jgi:3-oxoacyl-[acyl-carrier-protein] synthase II